MSYISNADSVLCLLKINGSMWLKEIAYQLSLDERAVRVALHRLQDEGCVKFPEKVYTYVRERGGRKVL